MENFENKLIRDKINSIENLPHDYVPLLDSKFELLMAGIPEPSKKRKRKWMIIPWGIAAGIAMLVLLNHPSSEKNNMNVNPPVLKHFVRQSENLPQNITSKKEIVKLKSPTLNINSTETISDKKEIVFIQNPDETTENTKPPIIDDSISKSTIVKIEKNNQIKLKKHRFAEIDFNDSPVKESLESESIAKRPKVDFKLNINNNIVQSSSSRPLHFKNDF